MMAKRKKEATPETESAEESSEREIANIEDAPIADAPCGRCGVPGGKPECTHRRCPMR
jgi:hypothetical protein